jgi:hypothetical protein
VATAPEPKPPARRVGCLFLPFLLLGLFFLALMGRALFNAAATYTWQSVPCRILTSEVRESGNRYHPWFGYLRYSWSAGEAERSTARFSSYTEAVRHIRRWPAESAATCYLDPGDPGGTLLERKGKSFFIAVFLPIPLIFVLVGAAGIYSNWRQPVQPARSTGGIGGRRVGAVLLILIGGVLCVMFIRGPVHHALAARSWSAQQCTVVRSEVRPQESDEGGDTYSPAVLYSYLIGGVEHRSDTYSFLTFSVGRNSAERAAGLHPSGSTATCYVNPADPDDAVLHPGPSFAWLIGIIPLAALAGGLALWR